MKVFLNKIFIFSAILGLVFFAGIFLPATPKARNFVLFSKIQKDSLLQNIESPRIIFVGGSNIVYGLNSEVIKDSLRLNPINTGLIATVGLSFMMDNTLPYVKSGDIVVLVPEYQQYLGSYAYGNQGLLRLLMDVDATGFSYLKKKQWFKLPKNLPDYFISKFDPNEYFDVKVNPAYRRDIFNDYGDSDAHWALKKQGFDPDEFTKKKLNKGIIKEMKSFEKNVNDLGAQLFISYPCFQATSFEINEKEIESIENEIKSNNFRVLGSAERYKMADTLMFDTPYHLIKQGVDLRTILLIEDIKESGVIK